MLNALFAIARPSSVCRLSVTRFHQSKTFEVMIMKFVLYGSPLPLAFEILTKLWNSDGSPTERGRQTRTSISRKPKFND